MHALYSLLELGRVINHRIAHSPNARRSHHQAGRTEHASAREVESSGALGCLPSRRFRLIGPSGREFRRRRSAASGQPTDAHLIAATRFGSVARLVGAFEELIDADPLSVARGAYADSEADLLPAGLNQRNL